jgi:hypothetical protein
MQVLIILFFNLFIYQTDSDYIKVNMNKRVNQNGVTTSINAEIFYGLNGKMVTKYENPKEILVINDSDGQIIMYDKNENTVIQNINYAYSTENSNFFYFLNSDKRDMGLEKMGFLLNKTEFDENMLVTTWQAPLEMRQHFSGIKLVLENNKPIYMDYSDSKGKIIKKMFFSDFTDVKGKAFPKAITEINYSKKDSIVSKTTFSSIVDNVPEAMNLLNFKIPENAKYIKK